MLKIAGVEITASTSLVFDWVWLRVNPQDGLTFKMGFLYDTLSVAMLFLILVVSFAVHLYSFSYMYKDRRFLRFLSFLSLFTLCMIGLVLSTNFLQLFVFWELVGLCSYLLIGFWYHKKSAAEAARKAFIVTRFADTGLFLAVIYIGAFIGDFSFSVVAEALSGSERLIFSLLLFFSAMGKSAIFPLHLWLPDAMEGPTPASALIHAATMVTAGVFLLLRCFVFFQNSPVAPVIAWLGGFTALMAALIAVVKFDLKKILAYSTISHLGLMVAAFGIEAASAGGGRLSPALFHLLAHGFFKSLLFLGAGVLIHAAGSNDIRNMGGFLRRNRVFALPFLIGAGALAGLPPFSGFFSKDAILESAIHSSCYGLYFLLSFVSFLSAFYVGRFCFILLSEGNVPAEKTPFLQIMSLYLLAFLSLVGGFFQGGFDFWQSGMVAAGHAWAVVLQSVLVVLAGFWLAGKFYYSRSFDTDVVKRRIFVFYRIVMKKFYVDEIWVFLLTYTLEPIGSFCRFFDRRVIDGVFVNGTGGFFKSLSSYIRYMQTGTLQTYLLIGFTCVVLVVGFMRSF